MKKLLIAIAVFVAALIPASVQSQVVNYHLGTIIGNGSPQGYHVGTVQIGAFNDRVSLRAATFTPWEFGEVWLGPNVEWLIPRSAKFQADMVFGFSIVGRIDGNFQPLKNLRPAFSGGISFEENPDTGEIYLIFEALPEWTF